MANIKDFLLELERNEQLLKDYREAGTKQARKDIAKTKGSLNETQAEVLQSKKLKPIRDAINNETPGETFFCVVMVD